MKLLTLLLCVLPALCEGDRVAIVDVAFKQQSKTVWSVVLYNNSPLQPQVSRQLLLIKATQVSQLLAGQEDAAQNNGFFAVTARTGNELRKEASPIISGLGIALKQKQMVYIGAGLGVLDYFIQRAQDRSKPAAPELPALVALAPMAGAEYLIHTVKCRNGLPSVVFQLSLTVP
jgi:hypothetical protein